VKILFSSTAGLGHLLPLIPIARAVRHAGHQVQVLTDAKHSGRLADLDLRHRVLAGPSAADRERVLRAADPADVHAGPAQIFSRLNPVAGLPSIRSAFRDWRPDVVVTESAEFSAGLVAETEGVPVVRVHPGQTGLQVWERLVGPSLAEIRRDLGLRPDPEAHWLLDAPQVGYFPVEFDPPRPGAGMAVRVRSESAIRPGPVRRELIYITFGTEIVGMPFFSELARAASNAARRTALDVLFAVGDADPAALPDLGDVRCERWVDQRAALPTARAVICHAGAGTTLGALAAGTPIVAVPWFADQPFNADRIAATQTGLAVPPGPDLEIRISAALDEVLASEPLGCRPMAEAVRALPDLSAALTLIKSVAAMRQDGLAATTGR
jgi:UDP:flavonoid glycosyltransferase YjiC (YdhE family)